jgi:hypothetical protein
MSTTTLERPAVLLTTTAREARQQRRSTDAATTKGFSSTSAAKSRKRKAGGKRSHALSKADWGPLGKHPDLDAVVARQRLHLPLSGRLSEAEVNQAWKRCAGEHHPDRGGEHSAMQLVNGARDLLLGRSLN